MREEFEKMPEIEQGLRHCHYDESTNIYHADAAHVEEFEWHTQFVNGAWYAYQEQQKKIDALKENLKKLEDHTFINYDDERDDDQHSYWSGYNAALGEIAAIIEENNNDT